MARAKRGKPYDPAKVHDRRSTDLLRNAKVEPIEVDDPIEVGGKLIVMRSIRNDPLAGLHARRHIDEAQYQGGRAFQYDFETIQSRPQAVDASQPYVDCSLRPRGISAAFSESLARLKLADRELGQEGAAIVRNVLIHGMTIEQIGMTRGLTNEPDLKYLGRRFRECLECLALVYGFAMEKRS